MSKKNILVSIMVGLMLAVTATWAASIDLSTVSFGDKFTAQDVKDTDISGQRFKTTFESQELEGEEFTVSFTVQNLELAGSDYIIGTSTQEATCSAGEYNNCRADCDTEGVKDAATCKTYCIGQCHYKIMKAKQAARRAAERNFLAEQEELNAVDYFTSEIVLKDLELSQEDFN